MIPIRYAPLYFVTVLVLFFGLNIVSAQFGLLEKEMTVQTIFLMATGLTAIKFLLIPLIFHFLGGSSNQNHGDQK